MEIGGIKMKATTNITVDKDIVKLIINEREISMKYNLSEHINKLLREDFKMRKHRMGQ